MPEAMHAEISRDGSHRYSLTRIWSHGSPLVVWVMLNPSTADGSIDDPTIRKVRGFTQRNWPSSGGFVVLNLFSFRATDPRALALADVNDRHSDYELAWWFARAASNDWPVVLAWGAYGHVYPTRVRQVLELSRTCKRFCLGVTASAQPKHPLMLPYSASLLPWDPS